MTQLQCRPGHDLPAGVTAGLGSAPGDICRDVFICTLAGQPQINSPTPGTYSLVRAAADPVMCHSLGSRPSASGRARLDAFRMRACWVRMQHSLVYSGSSPLCIPVPIPTSDQRMVSRRTRYWLGSEDSAAASLFASTPLL